MPMCCLATVHTDRRTDGRETDREATVSCIALLIAYHTALQYDRLEWAISSAWQAPAWVSVRQLVPLADAVRKTPRYHPTVPMHRRRKFNNLAN